jgi:hypothetical protein
VSSPSETKQSNAVTIHTRAEEAQNMIQSIEHFSSQLTSFRNVTSCATHSSVVGQVERYSSSQRQAYLPPEEND